MSYQDKIRTLRPKMSKSFAKLADYLLDYYIEASFMTATELAHRLNIDAATVVRFSQSLGYQGFPQLLKDIQAHVKNELLTRPKELNAPDTIAGVINNAIDDLKFVLEQTKLSLDPNSVERLSNQIGMTDRIFILSGGAALPSAHNLAYFLEQGGFHVIVARSGTTGLARVIHTATPEDLILAIDIAEESPSIAPALAIAHEKGVTTATIASSPSLPSTRNSDIILSTRGSESLRVSIAIVEAIIFVIVQVLLWHYASRFSGVEQEIEKIKDKILANNGENWRVE